ncbi:MAG: glucose-6-phosphate isomerase [Spirochaetales bacterium]|jgi:glucose-6-phosphate isomerase|nr:glucose-6-phosphate isomerase [Spirochaetales bacterium]
MQELNYNNLDQCEAFDRLRRLFPASPKPGAGLGETAAELNPRRALERDLNAGGGLRFNFAARGVSAEALDLLFRLAEEQQAEKKYRSLLSGEIMNTGENRMVLHHLSRGQVLADKPVLAGGRDLGAFYRGERERFSLFARRVREGEIRGSTGKPFKTVVQIGIGGSDLGPRALYLALRGWAEAEGITGPEARFLSNVDPDDAAEVLAGLNPEECLFILVSKSGTTQETLTNHALVVQRLQEGGIPGLDPRGHMVAVTSQTSPLAASSDFLDSFFMDDYIGGRYSSTSAVGGLVLSLAFGPETFEEVLAGAHEGDLLALEPAEQNAALTDALLGVFDINIRGLGTSAILPYSQALIRFPAHLQQLDMESNGKQVNRRGEPIGYSTGPVILGEPGTNGQHSFYQLLHQGTGVVPLQFIGFSRSQRGRDRSLDGATSQEKLNANLAAQIVALALGQKSDNPNKNFPGGRPSSLLYGDRLTPRTLGSLLAHFENKVMFQGFLWNLNSFDQEGVQLGKVLTGKVLAGRSQSPSPGDNREALLKFYAGLLGL